MFFQVKISNFIQHAMSTIVFVSEIYMAGKPTQISSVLINFGIPQWIEIIY